MEAYRGLTAGGALTVPPTPGLGLSLQDDLIYLRSSYVAAVSEAWLRSDLLGPPPAAWWQSGDSDSGPRLPRERVALGLLTSALRRRSRA